MTAAVAALVLKCIHFCKQSPTSSISMAQNICPPRSYFTLLSARLSRYRAQSDLQGKGTLGAKKDSSRMVRAQQKLVGMQCQAPETQELEAAAL